MLTFNYQGQTLSGHVVDSMDGSLNIFTRGDYSLTHEGKEEIIQDAHGLYYLRRKLNVYDVDGDFEHVASGREHVHRISLKAACLWAIMRCNAETHDLRRDLVEALRPAAVQAGAGKVTVPLTLPLYLYREVLAMSAYDEREGFAATVEHCLYDDVQAWLESDDQGHAPKRFLRQYGHELEAGIHPHLYPPAEFTAQRLGSNPVTPAAATEEPVDDQYILHLDQETRTRLDRYLEVTPWDYTAGDLLNGCVVLALDLAFANQEEAEQRTGLKSETFHDGAWGTVEMAIYQAQVRREGVEKMVRPEPDVSAEADAQRALVADARRQEASEAGASEADENAPLEIVDLRGTPAADRTDVALCAASAVESDDEEDEKEEDNGEQPLRPMLAALAAEWQSKAQEARSQAEGFASLPAKSKHSAQADLLEGCAGALMSALNGKEGK